MSLLCPHRNVWPKIVYGYFTRTTSFTTTVTVIIVVEKYVCTKFHRNWLLCECYMAMLCPYHNVMPEAVYCCFTRTILFTKLFTCLYDQS